MSELEISKQADYYAEQCNGGSKGSGIIQQSWKAGYRFRDKEIDGLLKALKKIRDFDDDAEFNYNDPGEIAIEALNQFYK